MKIEKILILLFIAGIGFLWANQGGGALPWEGPLGQIKESIQGPVAMAISLMAIVAAGVALVFGGDFSGFVKSIIYTVLVIAVIVGAANILQIAGGNGALI